MVGQHALSSTVTVTIATRARLGDTAHANDALAALDRRSATAGEIRNAAAVVRLVEGDPPAPAVSSSPSSTAARPTDPSLTLIEALPAGWGGLERPGRRAGRLGGGRAALVLAEPDRLILPFAMTGASHLLAALPPSRNSTCCVAADILDAVLAEPAERCPPNQPNNSARASCVYCATCRPT